MNDQRNYHLDTAAERIRRVAAGETVAAVYTSPEDRVGRTEYTTEQLAIAAYQMDSWRLARAYLSNSFYCRKCNGTGRVQVPTGTPGSEGGEDWRLADCERCGGTGSQP
jgi:hypothetical protein